MPRLGSFEASPGFCDPVRTEAAARLWADSADFRFFLDMVSRVNDAGSRQVIGRVDSLLQLEEE
jgi:hypothetical protein